jgi:CRP-like cAMP-binding protein/Na+/melibiose symporter-like transporter
VASVATTADGEPRSVAPGFVSSASEKIRRSLDAVREVFRERDLRYLELSFGLNGTAENAYLVALAVYAYDAGGATAVGLVGLIRMIPAGVAGLFGSVVADRYRREWVLRMLYLARAVLCGATALAFFSGAPVAVVFALAALLNIAAVLLRPALWALLPDLARTPEQLVACNGVWSVFEGISWLVGPAAAAVLIAVASPGVAFVFAGLALLGAVACAAWVKAEQVPERKPAERHVVAETIEGVRAVARDRHARLLYICFGAQTTVRGALNVLVVVAAIELLEMGEAGVGWLNSAFGIGGIAGAVASLALVGRRKLGMPYGLGLAMWGAPIALLAAMPHPAAALLLLGIPGVGNAILDVSGFTMLQRIIPSNVLGRAFGALEAQVFATVGLGSVLAPVLVGWLGVRGALVAVGASLPALALVSWPRLRSIDVVTVVPERELALLRSVPMFAALPAIALEHLAARMESETVPAKSVVIREGETGDRFYMIARGRASVMLGRRRSESLTAGDWFGEIALVRGVPRTATVKAATELEIFSVPGDAFLTAVSGSLLSASAAERSAADRVRANEDGRAHRALARAATTSRRVAKKPAAKKTAATGRAGSPRSPRR